MQKELKSMDVTNMPDLLRLAEEVQATKQPRVLTRGGEELVEMRPLMPVVKRSLKRPKTQADLEAFRSAAGGWKGLVDPEAFKAAIMSARASDRLPVDL